MNGFIREAAAAARLDLAEVRRSRWLVFAALVYAGLIAVFLLAGLRESALFGFTGMGRVLMSFAHALVLVLPLLALTATAQVVGRARDDGLLELLFSLPIRRSAWFAGVTAVRYAVLLAPLAVLLVGAGLLGRLAWGQPVPWSLLGRSLAICAALLLAFTGVGLALSTFARDQARAMIAAILVWALAIALLDFGVISAMLRWHLNARLVFLLAAANPVEASRLALLSGLAPDLATLGPVGFYLSTRVGSALLLALGIAWPALAGAAAWSVALARFRKADVV